MKRRWTMLLTTCAVTAGLLAGCGGAAENGSRSMTADTAAPVENSAAATQGYYGGGVASDSYATAEEAAVETELEIDGGVTTEQEGGTQQSDDVTLLEEKLVYHCDLEIETLDYPATINSIKEAITKYDGVIQSESESDSGYNWYYKDYRKTGGTLHDYLEIRIPSKVYNHFLEELDGVGKVVSKSTSVDNISQQYYDTTAQIEALKIQEQNLLAMMEKCETIEDMITVEQRLSEVQYQLNNLQTTRRYMDMDVAYSYVNINVSEVMEYRQESEPVKRNTFVDRLKNTLLSTGRGFLSFLEGLLFLLIRMAPYIIILVVIGIVFPVKKIRKFAEKRRAGKMTGNVQKVQPPVMRQDQNTTWQMMPPPVQTTEQQSPQNQQEK